MSWIYPGEKVLAGLPRAWARTKEAVSDEQRQQIIAARKERTRIVAKRWAAWNREKVRAMQRKYSKTEKGLASGRRRQATYRASKKQKAQKLSTEKARNPLTD
jgi:hypothetical protein